MKSKRVCIILLVVAILSSFIIINLGCDKEPNELKQETNIHNKLDAKLNTLVLAEERRETEELLATGGYSNVIGDKVRVSIQANADQLTEAIEIVESYGIVEVVSERRERIQALIPIADLVNLNREDAIKLIETPVQLQELSVD